VRRTSDSGSTSWPTPTSALADKGVRSEQGAIIEERRRKGVDLAAVVSLTSWPTPTVDRATCTRRGGDPDQKCLTLPGAAALSSWATPSATESGGTPEQQQQRKRRAQEKGKSLGASVTALSLQAQLASWATPTSRDWKDGASDGTAPENGLLPEDSGETPTGSSAATGSGDRLNPEFVRWLMGYPAAWDVCAATATRSSRGKRRRS
jgi:hypothetical protein